MGPMSYEGPEKYIFISYAHKDSDRVLKILERMTEAGYRIWYDDGIAPGSEWPEDIATHLDGCAVFLAFVSNNSIASANCRREVTFALSRQKDFLGIVLEPTKMSLGMEMQLSAQQCILRQNYRREEDFIRKIFSCPDLDCCKTQPEPPAVEAPAPVQAETPPVKAAKPPVKKEKPPKPAAPRQKKKLTLPLIIAGAVLAAALIITPIALLLSSNAPIQVAEGTSVHPKEDTVSLRGKVITRQSAEALNRLEKLGYLYFYDCTFEDGALDTLSLPELKQIKIENGQLTDFGFLADSTKLNTLELTNCGVTNDNVPFDVFTDLRYLTLSGNAAFSDLSAVPVEGLRIVKLSDTAVEDISALAAAKGMSEVYCANTKVASIDALASLDGLKVMDFTNCRIKAVDAPFMSLHMRELYLGGNGLASAEGFQNFTVVQVAYLGGNELQDVSWLAKSAAKLTKLDLSRNGLDAEDVEFVKKCTKLTYLDLSHIPMEDLTVAANKPDLKTLKASGCELKSILGIASLGELSRLYLDNNQIGDISGLPQIGLQKNVVLDLSYNRIGDIAPIPEGTYNVLSLLGNPVVYKSGDFNGLTGSRLFLIYDESLDDCGKTAFSKVVMYGCPADKQLALKNSFTSKLFYLTQEEMQAELEAQGLYHAYVN